MRVRHSPICAVLYWDENFGGGSFKIEETDEFNLPLNWNDGISSVGIKQGCTLKLFQDYDSGILMTTLTEDSTHLGENNNEVSSVSCECPHWLGGGGSCVLGLTRILMHDHSTKRIENIQVNDVILDGHLTEVTVVHVIKHYLSSTELFQFYPNGPIFTKDHQFLSNLETQNVGVVSKDFLFAIQPQMEEFSNMVHEFKDMEKVLQFKNGSISPEPFQVERFDKEMDPKTLMYGLITTGEDGTYIADNFLSRDVLPEVKMWPWTYGTLGMILNHCNTTFTFTLEGQTAVIDLTYTLANAWRVIIRDFDSNFKPNDSDSFMFEPLVESESAMQEILANEKKMMFGQYLQASSSKLLHQTLDNENLPKNHRFSLIKLLLKEATKHMSCNFPDLQ